VVILAGGKSRRMGRDKLSLEIKGQTLLQSVLERFSKEFDSVYLSVADDLKYRDVAVPKIMDIYPGAGPLGGLHTALSNLPGDGVFLVAADLPNATPDAAMRVIELTGKRQAGAIMLLDEKMEPLFAFYSRSLLPECESAINLKDYRMTEILKNADTRFISPDEMGGLWNSKILFNINYPEDYLEIL